MSDPGTVTAFGVLVLVALGLMSFMLWHRATALGHTPARVVGRLIVVWVCVFLAVGGGLVLRRIFPGGLFEINFTHSFATPWFALSGRDAGFFLAVGLLAMLSCALVALWAVSSLQRPPAGLPEAPPEGEGPA